MRKAVLFILMISLGIAVIGQASGNFGKHKMVKKPIMKVTPDGNVSGQESLIIGENRGIMDATMGLTWYDMQSYNNLMSRVYAYDDGTIGAVWQCAGQNLTPDRGTGYNYFDGFGWGASIPHLGSDTRTGWPCYAPWGPNGEIIAHYWYVTGQPGPIKFFRRENKGTGEWLESQVFGPEGVSLVWHSMFTSGENKQYVHLLARTYDVPYQGQENALLYYRSSDGGQTWDWEHVIIEGLGVDYFPTASNLSYTWAEPVGSTIAFSYGFDQFDGMVFKSDDNGENWEEILVYESPFPPDDVPADSDPFACGDGCTAIALDAGGMAHVVFSKMIHQYIGGELMWVPSCEGVIYWNETKPVLDSTIISTYTNDFLAEEGLLVGYILPDPYTGGYELEAEQFNYGCSYTSFPQLGIDEQNNMFLTYAAIAPGYSNGTNNYRHIHVNASYDNGLTWEGPIDINTSIFYLASECVYPVTPVHTTDKVHIIFQEDLLPGLYEWLANHQAIENRMIHMEFDKDYFVSVNEPSLMKPEIEVSSLYPNPAVTETNFYIELAKPTFVSLHITNALGQTVKDINRRVKNAGKNLITFDVSGLKSGIYYCIVNVENQSFTNKLMVE